MNEFGRNIHEQRDKAQGQYAAWNGTPPVDLLVNHGYPTANDSVKTDEGGTPSWASIAVTAAIIGVGPQI